MLGLIVSLPLLLAQAPAPAGGSTPAPAPPPAASAPATTSAPAPAAGQPAAAPAANPATPAPAKAPESPFGSLIIFAPIVVLFYLMILRPQQQQEKKRKELINTMERNTRVLTSGGMYGTVVSIDAETNTVLLRLGNDPGVKVEFARSAIVSVLDAGKDKKDAG